MATDAIDFVGPDLHDGQVAVVDSTARFRVLACGRRWGKTVLGASLAVARALDGGRVWWIGPTYQTAGEGWQEIKNQARHIPGAEIRESDRRVDLPGGGSVQVKSADNPNNLRGAGLDFAVLDEVRDMKSETWTHVIRPALADRQGGAVFISTPNGRDWFYDLFRKGEEADAPEWQSFRFPTSSNPFVEASEIAELEAELPDLVRRQELLAEFVDQGGVVFRSVRDAAVVVPGERPAGGPYFVFADLASTHDFNAVCVVRRSGADVEQVHSDRWNRVAVEDTLTRLRAVAARFPGRRAVDATGLGGDYAHQWLGRSWDAVKFTHDVKLDMIHHLQSLLETRRVKLFRSDVSEAAKHQYDELIDFNATRLPSGLYRYEAPSGKHDDMVTALMGACWLARETGGRISADPRIRALAL